jgi:hypothetical protein
MKNLLSIIFILVCGLSVFGQTRATTDDGKKVILKPDKTWDYIIEKPAKNLDAGDCSAYVDTSTDRMTGKVSTSGKAPIIISSDGGKTGFNVSLIYTESEKAIGLFFRFVEPGNGCADDNAPIHILFTDGSKLSLVSHDKFNCDGEATIFFRGVFGQEDILTKLTTKKIKALRIDTRKSSVERNFTDAQASELLRELNCIKKIADAGIK